MSMESRLGVTLFWNTDIPSKLFENFLMKIFVKQRAFVLFRNQHNTEYTTETASWSAAFSSSVFTQKKRTRFKASQGKTRRARELRHNRRYAAFAPALSSRDNWANCC